MFEIMEKISDEFVTEASEVKRGRKAGWVKWGAAAATLALAVGATGLGVWQRWAGTGPDTGGNNDRAGVSLENIDSGIAVSPLYNEGFDTVDQLLEGSPLIVRAVPVSVESESDAALCWVLRVEEANRETSETVRLRQLRDEYLLTAGQEVVLVLREDEGEGYYNIPGGGCGLFRLDESTGTVTGELLDSLLEQAVPAYSSNSAAQLTLEDVFNLLASASEEKG